MNKGWIEDGLQTRVNCRVRKIWICKDGDDDRLDSKRVTWWIITYTIKRITAWNSGLPAKKNSRVNDGLQNDYIWDYIIQFVRYLYYNVINFEIVNIILDTTIY